MVESFFHHFHQQIKVFQTNTYLFFFVKLYFIYVDLTPPKGIGVPRDYSSKWFDLTTRIWRRRLNKNLTVHLAHIDGSCQWIKLNDLRSRIIRTSLLLHHPMKEEKPSFMFFYIDLRYAGAQYMGPFIAYFQQDKHQH